MTETTAPEALADDTPSDTRGSELRDDVPPYSGGQRRLLVWGGAVVLALWCLGLLVFSTTLYRRNNLTADFGSYNQAWTLIGQGHFDPHDTIFLNYVPFWRNDFELILWPLGLLHLLTPKAIVLEWVQDLAVAATWFATYRWIIDYLGAKRVAWRYTLLVAVAVLLVIVIDPAVYQTLLFDWHIEPISTFCMVMIGWNLWRGRHRQAWLWVLPVLLCGTFASVTLVGVGISAILAGMATRRSGFLLIVTGLCWITLISVIGANKGSGLDFYAYLAGRSTLPAGGGLGLVAVGILTHPNRPWDIITGRLSYLYALIKPVGIVGIASAWGFGVPVVVLTANVLNSQLGFIYQPFQNSAVFPFLLLGTVMLLVGVAQRWSWGWVASAVVGALVLLQAVVYGWTTSPSNIRWAVARVTPATAGQLDHALDVIGPNDQVLATIGIMGRFSGRVGISWYNPGGIYTVRAPVVYFVFDPANENTIPNATPADDLAAAAYVQHVLGAQVVFSTDGVTVLRWVPPRGTRAFSLPGATVPAAVLAPAAPHHTG